MTQSTNGSVASLIAAIAAADRIVAFTGAGISTESGIPDYRGPGGVWETRKPPTIGDFLQNEKTRRDYWLRRRDDYPRWSTIEPNEGHRALVELERRGRLLGTITQNIDGLHQKAGSDPDRVVELHGTSHRVRCMNCGRQWDAASIQLRLESGEELPTCEVCGGPLRSATILFGEALSPAVLERAAALAAACDLMLVVGSSLVVNPAAQLPLIAKRRGATLVILNRTETPLDAIADIRLYTEAGPTLTEMLAALPT